MRVLPSVRVAPARYARAVLRFHTYGIEAGGLSKGYMETALLDEYVCEWISGAEREEEVIEKLEAGRI